MKTINYYRKVQYGVEREFIHPDCETDARTLLMLTGKRTIDQTVRGLVQMLSEGTVQFQEVLAPREQTIEAITPCGTVHRFTL